MAEPVKSITPKVFQDDKDSDPSELPERLRVLQQYLIDAVERDCRKFAKNLSEWRDCGLYRHFSSTWEEFVAEHIKQPFEWVDHMMKGVAMLDRAATAEEAVQTYRNSKQYQAEQAKVLPQRLEAAGEELNSHGGNRNPHGCKGRLQEEENQFNQGKNDSREVEYDVGNSSRYLAKRIKRDFPEIHERLKAGEFPSINAAAVEAGIRKPPKKGITIPSDGTAQEIAGILYEKFPDVELLREVARQLLDAIG